MLVTRHYSHDRSTGTVDLDLKDGTFNSFFQPGLGQQVQPTFRKGELWKNNQILFIFFLISSDFC